MGLSIGSIQNGVIKNIALEVDENGDGQISGAKELKLFKNKCAKAVEHNLCSPEDVENAMLGYQVQISNIKNAYLQGLAQRNEINKDDNEILDGNELKSFVEASQDYLKSSFATEEDLEESTEGFYSAKTLSDKAVNVGAHVVGGTAGAAAGVVAARTFNTKLYYPFMHKLAKSGKFENVLTTYKQEPVKFNGMTGWTSGRRVLRKGVRRGAIGLGLTVMALGAYFGQKLAGKATE